MLAAAALAVCAGAPCTLLLYGGLALAPAAGGAVIITGAPPVISAAPASLWLGEQPGPARLAGMALTVVGLVLVGWPGIAGGSRTRTWLGLPPYFAVAGGRLLTAPPGEVLFQAL